MFKGILHSLCEQIQNVQPQYFHLKKTFSGCRKCLLNQIHMKSFIHRKSSFILCQGILLSSYHIASWSFYFFLCTFCCCVKYRCMFTFSCVIYLIKQNEKFSLTQNKHPHNRVMVFGHNEMKCAKGECTAKLCFWQPYYKIPHYMLKIALWFKGCYVVYFCC